MSTTVNVTTEGDVTVGVEYNPVAGSGTDTNIGITRTSSAVVVTSSSGTDGTILAADGTNAGVFTSANYTKLAGISGTNTGDQNIFKNVAVAGQSTVVADSTNDTLTLVAGTNITLTTDAAADTITITASGGGGTGDVVGPASATNGAFALFDTTTGKLLKNGSVPGGAAVLNVGTTTGTVAAGDDSRLTNARTPTSHASTHVTGGTDAIQSATASQNGLATSTQITKLDGIEALADVTDAANVAAAGAVMKTLADAKGDLFAATAADTITRLPIGVSNGYVLTVDSAETTGMKWTAPSGSGGDVVGPASATDGAFALFDTTTGKLLKNGSVPGGAATLNVGTTAGTVAAGDDSRFTNSRTPTAHASTHITGGSDAIQSATHTQDGLATSTQIAKLNGIEAGADVTDTTNVQAALTGATITGITSISSTTFVGSLTGTASGNLTSGGALGTPSSGTLSNCTGLPVGSVSGLGTGVSTALAVNVGTAGAPVVNGGVLGTPSSGSLANCTGLPVGSITGLGTGVATALAINVESAGAPVVNGGALGTPSSGSLASCTGLSLTTGVTGDLPLANLAQSSAASKLLGRGSASGAGDFQEITLGTNLSMSGTTLNATGGGGSSPQPVQAVLTTTATTTSTTYADITGLTASYTPTSTTQKVLVRGSISFGSTSSNQTAFRLARDGTALTQATASGSRTVSHAAFLDTANGLGMESTSFEFLDTPGTTSAVTYSIQWKRGGSSGTCYLNRAQDDLDYDSRANTVSTLTVIPFAV